MAATTKTLHPHQKYAAARLWANRARPYYSAALLALQPRWVPGLDTFAVTDRGIVLIGEVAVEQWTVEQIGSVLVHEVEHVLRRHGARTPEGADPTMWNVAVDAEVNDDCDDLNLPEGVITPKWLCERSKLPNAAELYANGRLGEAYYAAMLSEPQDAKQQQRQTGGAPGAGQCGSAAGNPHPEEKPEEQQSGHAKMVAAKAAEKAAENEARAAAAKAAHEAGEQPVDADGSEPSDEQGDSDVGGLSEAEMDAIRAECAGAIKAAAEQVGKGKGRLPAGVARWAEGVLAPPKVRWQDKVRRLCARSCAEMVRGKQDTSYTRMSRRQHIALPGTILPGQVGFAPLVMFVQDTSGSMDDSDVRAGAAELQSIARALNGAKVLYTSCDAKVQAAGLVTSWKDVAVKGLVKGGGGTDFQPIFRHAAKMRRKPDLIVVHTDGYGTFPSAAPVGTKVVWVSTSLKTDRFPFGEVVEV